jgi:hypothetical protein
MEKKPVKWRVLKSRLTSFSSGDKDSHDSGDQTLVLCLVTHQVKIHFTAVRWTETCEICLEVSSKEADKCISSNFFPHLCNLPRTFESMEDRQITRFVFWNWAALEGSLLELHIFSQIYMSISR